MERALLALEGREGGELLSRALKRSESTSDLAAAAALSEALGGHTELSSLAAADLVAQCELLSLVCDRLGGRDAALIAPATPPMITGAKRTIAGESTPEREKRQAMPQRALIPPEEERHHSPD